MDVNKEIDARGLNCPLPLMKAKMAMKEMKSGEILRVLATDSGSMRDILEFVSEAGHTMLSQEHVGKDYIHIMQHS